MERAPDATVLITVQNKTSKIMSRDLAHCLQISVAKKPISFYPKSNFPWQKFVSPENKNFVKI